MLRFVSRLTVLVVALTALALLSGDAGAAKKPKTDAPPPGFSKVTAVNADDKTFMVFGDDTNFKYTSKTTNNDKIAVGTFVKLTLKDGSKTDVTAVEAAPATPAKKKKKKDNQ